MQMNLVTWTVVLLTGLLASCVTSRQEQMDEHPERNPGLALLNQARTPGECRLHIVDCIDGTYGSEPARKLCRARMQDCLSRTTAAQRAAESPQTSAAVPSSPRVTPPGGTPAANPPVSRTQPPTVGSASSSTKPIPASNAVNLGSLSVAAAVATIALPADDVTGRPKTVAYRFPKDASHCLQPSSSGNEVRLINKCTEPIHSVTKTDNMRGQPMGGYLLLDNRQGGPDQIIPYMQGPYAFTACFANERFCTHELLVAIGHCTQHLLPMQPAQGYSWNLRSTAYPLDCAAGAEQRKTNIFASRTNAFERFNVETGRRVIDYMNSYLPANAARSPDQVSRCVVGLHTGILRIVIQTRDEFQKKEGLPRSACEQSLFGGP